MEIKLFNTLGKELQTFKPLEEGKVGMYHCGPTVYNYAHVGNLRAYVFADLLRRLFEYENYEVKQVINITDFGHLTSDADDGDDKMTSALKREGKEMTLEAMEELGEYYMHAYVEDLKKLNIMLPHYMPKASGHIKEDIEFIQALLDRGFAYYTSDGIYFDTSKDSEYLKLVGSVPSSSEEHSRILPNSEKRNPVDFALWKFSDPHNPDAPGFEAPSWDKGFPGWHIECSGMAKKYLGDTFDIHTGGIDHIPVHHTNEIAQSESANGVPLAAYWLHGNFITIDGQKISKSLGNDIYMKDLEESSIDPLAYRYWLLTSHYQSLANFTWEALQGAANAYDKLVRQVAQTSGASAVRYDLSDRIISPIYHNLETPKAIAEIWEMLRADGIAHHDKIAAILEADKLLGLDLEKQARKLLIEEEIPADILVLAAERLQARNLADFDTADRIRAQIEKMGYEIKDIQNGQQIKKTDR